MRNELIVKTKSMASASDLTLFAPIRPGLVSSLEAVTYKTRVKRLLMTLNAGRCSSHEYVLLRPFSDAVERVGRIHSVRVTVVEPEDKVLLAAAFDGTWEAYIRVLWQKVGSLLDDMQVNVVTMPEFAHVTHVNLRGTLSRGADYKDFWGNELHPTKPGFERLARKFDEVLAKL